LLFFSLLLKAQEEENVPTITDTTIVEEVTGEDEPGKTDAGTSTDTYFYRRSDTLTIEQRNIPPAVVKKMKEDGDFWYVNTDLKGSQKKAEAERRNGKKGQKGKEPAINEKDDGYTPIGQRSWFQTLLWIIIVGGFATFLIIYLGGSNVGLFRKKNRLTSNGEEEQLITEDIFAINYQKEIDKAAKEGNYRMAIRLMFLRVLKNMSEKNIISYKQDKTNLDYLLEVRPSHYYTHFFRVTRNYEYSWYGLFPVSEDAYKLIRGDFDRFDKELR
jgi:hypothetical protein